MEVYVQPFPPTGQKRQVSLTGGMDPAWRQGELLFTDPNRMLVTVPVTVSGSAFSTGRAVPLFEIPTRGLASTGFDISPDGRRVLVQMVTPAAPQPLMIVLNWMALLKTSP
jgi:hypothetical protein